MKAADIRTPLAHLLFRPSLGHDSNIQSSGSNWKRGSSDAFTQFESDENHLWVQISTPGEASERESWGVEVETPTYDLTVFHIHYGKLSLKIYSKGECVLRIEVMVHNGGRSFS